MGFLSNLFDSNPGHVERQQAGKLRDQASGLITQAQGGYQNLAGQGQQDRNTYNSQFPSIYNQFLNAAGLQNTTGYGQNRTPSGTGQAAPSNPYSLTQPQQTQLNAQSDQYTQQAQSAIDEYKAQAAQHGLTPSPAAEAMIREHFAASQEQGKANFQETARANQQNAAGTMLSLLAGIGQQGSQETQGAAAGEGNLAGEAGQLAGSAAQQAQSLQNQQTQTLTGLGTLLSYLFGGGVGGAAGAAAGALTGGKAPTVNANKNGVSYGQIFGPPASLSTQNTFLAPNNDAGIGTDFFGNIG